MPPPLGLRFGIKGLSYPSLLLILPDGFSSVMRQSASLSDSIDTAFCLPQNFLAAMLAVFLGWVLTGSISILSPEIPGNTQRKENIIYNFFPWQLIFLCPIKMSIAKIKVDSWRWGLKRFKKYIKLAHLEATFIIDHFFHKTISQQSIRMTNIK